MYQAGSFCIGKDLPWAMMLYEAAHLILDETRPTVHLNSLVYNDLGEDFPPMVRPSQFDNYIVWC